MAFEIGDRVISSWTGPGTVIGSLERDEDGIAMQLVHFDSDAFGTRLRAVGKLQPLDSEDEPKVKPIRKAKGKNGV
jgi:hypothetical protein